MSVKSGVQQPLIFLGQAPAYNPDRGIRILRGYFEHYSMETAKLVACSLVKPYLYSISRRGLP